MGDCPLTVVASCGGRGSQSVGRVFLKRVDDSLSPFHGAQSDVGNREGWHDNKAVCGKAGGNKSLRNMKSC